MEWWLRNAGILISDRGWYIYFALPLKMASWACLVRSGLRLIFHGKSQLFIISKSLLRLFVDVWASWTAENKEVSSANSFTLEVRSSVRSLR